MDGDSEALNKARRRGADAATLCKMAKGHLEEGRFEDAAVCLRLVEQHALIGRECLVPLLGE